jgi:hypothetical protein
MVLTTNPYKTEVVNGLELYLCLPSVPIWACYGGDLYLYPTHSLTTTNKHMNSIGKLIWSKLIADAIQLSLHSNNTEVCTNTTLSKIHIFFMGSFYMKLILKEFSSEPIYPFLLIFLYLHYNFPLHLSE